MVRSSNPIRGFLIDCARTLENPDYYRKALDFVSDRGISRFIWHFSDDQGCQLQFKSVPGIGSPNACTVHETRLLIEYAKDRGIVIVPEIASLGHSRYITRLPQYQHLNENEGAYSGICPVHSQTREVIAALIRETIEIFDSPEIHVGLDEVGIGQHPLTRETLKTRSQVEIIADHIRFVHDLVVTEGGRQMWMWGDGLLAAPEMLKLIPKDIVICNWQYRPTADAASTQRLLDAGFDVITASALLSFEQPLLPSNDYALQNVRAMRGQRELNGKTTGTVVRGEIVTTWIPARSISESQWLGWHLAAEILDRGPAADLSASIKSFGQTFYGLLNPAAWSEVANALLNLTPERTEWLAVVKADVDELTPELAASIIDKSARWPALVEQLTSIRPNVCEHLDAFDASILMLRLLAHTYEASAYLLTATNQHDDPAPLRQLIRQRRKLLEELEAAWDSERFANDPAKFEAVIEFFRDEHLLILVRDGLKLLQSRLAIATSVTPSIA